MNRRAFPVGLPLYVCGAILCLKIGGYGAALLFRAFLHDKVGGGGGRGGDKLNKYTSVCFMSSCVPCIK